MTMMGGLSRDKVVLYVRTVPSPARNDAKIQEFYMIRSLEKGILQKCRNFTRFRLNTSQFEENDAAAQQFRDISPDLAKIAALLQECHLAQLLLPLQCRG
ncbi:hypothetical protein [Paenibacillus thiaminolyticus]|uniref:Uncharacterized protein n=1 Tax=Paenibacillus thiaminolyticus TaxID=49283 RepID=A0A3A3GGW9_PANTH|nr:hypothetical protein [Paenibacillus thiaminolyticus]RJG21010.1 hypothetical protein DQX05_22810 [Paenibacillus thiaminolyticus]RJG21498.1 hypothetical protein DQX05_20905 [Paenibacillus thiaminolyticus]